MTGAFRELLGRIMSVFRRAERDQEFDEELQSHLQHAIADNIGRGLSPEEARRVALASLGGLDQTRELHRDSRGLPALEAIRRDAAYAVRTLKRDATLTTFAVLIVGLGVGASSTVFSILNTLLLRPLPFSDSDRLVWVANGNSSNLSSQTVQVDNLLDLRSQSRSFDGIEGYSPFYGNGDIRLTGAGEPERLTGVPVTEGFFRLLGVTPELGRLFTPEECRWNAPKTVVLSHRFWQRRFAADPRVVGTSVHLDGVPATVVGVLPATFDFASTFSPGNRADLFTPYPLTPETNAHGNTLALIARLKPHADIKTASAEAAVIGQRINRERLIKQARRNTFGPRVTTLRDRVSGRFQNAALILAGAVTIVMLIVCANVSNLLLVRASARQKEMAIRAALGAGRRQLIRQMLIESTLLACCGGVLGLLLAAGGTSLLAKWDDTAIPLLAHVELDKVAAGFALLLSMLTGLAFGMTPALQISATAPNDTLKDEGRGSTGGKQRAWLRSCFVVAEVAVVCVLLTGAGLLMRSLVQVLNVDLGFESDNVLALRVDPPREYSSLSQRNSYFDQVLRSARDIPGVRAAALTDALPLGDNFGWRTWDATPSGEEGSEHERKTPLVRLVDDSYFETMQIPLRAGRVFSLEDHASSDAVVIVNEALARSFWPGRDPLGRTLTTNNKPRRVVGVVGGVRYFGLERGSELEMYMPIRHVGDSQVVDLVIRGAIPVTRLAPAVREALRRVDPNLPATEFRTMQQLVDRSVFPRRFVFWLVGAFAAFGLILASLGIYGVMSYSVGQRTQEIGVRMALGASARHLQASILRQTMELAALGLLIGVPASWMTARLIQAHLFGVSSSDRTTFGAVLIILTVVAALAGYVPARRASRLNPLDALRVQ